MEPTARGSPLRQVPPRCAAAVGEPRWNELDVPGTVDFDRVYRIVDTLTEIGQARSATPAQVALNWVMNKPGVDTVIIGARDEAQLQTTWRRPAGACQQRR